MPANIHGELRAGGKICYLQWHVAGVSQMCTRSSSTQRWQLRLYCTRLQASASWCCRRRWVSSSACSTLRTWTRDTSPAWCTWSVHWLRSCCRWVVGGCLTATFTVAFLVSSSPKRWPNKPSKNLRPSICPNTMQPWDIHDDMTFQVIRGQGQGHVRLSFKHDDFQNLSPPPFFNQSKTIQWFLILDQNI